MADVVDLATRSRMMAAIGPKNSLAELRVRRYVHAAGLRYLLHDRRLPGSPDLVFPRRRVVVFVHGCFWHRHRNCANCTTPKTRADFWQRKFKTNVTRDQKAISQLESMGWTCITIWECETASEATLDELAWRLIAAGEEASIV